MRHSPVMLLATSIGSLKTCSSMAAYPFGYPSLLGGGAWPFDSAPVQGQMPMAVVPGQNPTVLDSSIASNDEEKSNARRQVIVHRHTHLHPNVSPSQRDQSSAMKREIESKNRLIHDTELRLQKLTEANGELESAVHVRDDKIGLTQAESDTLRSELKGVSEQLVGAKTSLAAKDNELAAASRIIHDNQLRLQQLQAETGKLKSEGFVKDEEIRRIQADSKKLRSKLEEVSEQLSVAELQSKDDSTRNKQLTITSSEAELTIQNPVPASNGVVDFAVDHNQGKASNVVTASRKASEEKAGQRQPSSSTIKELDLVEDFNEGNSVIPKYASLAILGNLGQ